MLRAQSAHICSHKCCFRAGMNMWWNPCQIINLTNVCWHCNVQSTPLGARGLQWVRETNPCPHGAQKDTKEGLPSFLIDIAVAGSDTQKSCHYLESMKIKWGQNQHTKGGSDKENGKNGVLDNIISIQSNQPWSHPSSRQNINTNGLSYSP